MKKSHEFKGNIGLERIYVKKRMERHNSNVENVKPSDDVSRWKKPERVLLLKMEDGKKKMKDKAIVKSNDLLVERVFNLLTEKRRVKSHAYAPGYRRLASGGVIIDCYGGDAGSSKFRKMHSKTANRWREEKTINEQNQRLHNHIKAIQSPFRKEVIEEDYRKHRALTKILNNKVAPAMLHLGLTGKIGKNHPMFSPYETNIARMKEKKENEKHANNIQSTLQVAKGFYSFAYNEEYELDTNRFIPDYHPIICIDKSSFPSLANQTTGDNIIYKYKHATTMNEREQSREEALKYLEKTGIDLIAQLNSLEHIQSKSNSKSNNHTNKSDQDDIYDHHNATYNYLMSTCHPCGDEKLWFLNQIDDEVEDEVAYAQRQEEFLNLNRTNTIASRIPNGGVSSPLRGRSESGNKNRNMKTRPQSAPSVPVNRHVANAANALKPTKTIIPPGQEVNYLYHATTNGQKSEPEFYTEEDAMQTEAEILEKMNQLRKQDEKEQDEIRKKKNKPAPVLNSLFTGQVPPPSVPKPAYCNSNTLFEQKTENNSNRVTKSKGQLVRPKSASNISTNTNINPNATTTTPTATATTSSLSSRRKLNEALKAATANGNSDILVNKQHEKAINVKTHTRIPSDKAVDVSVSVVESKHNSRPVSSTSHDAECNRDQKRGGSVSPSGSGVGSVHAHSTPHISIQTKRKNEQGLESESESEPKDIELPPQLQTLPSNMSLRQNLLFKCKMMAKLEFPIPPEKFGVNGSSSGNNTNGEKCDNNNNNSNKNNNSNNNSNNNKKKKKSEMQKQYPFEVKIYDVGVLLSGADYGNVYCLQPKINDVVKDTKNQINTTTSNNNNKKHKNIVTSRGIVIEACLYITKHTTNLGDSSNQDIVSNTDRLMESHVSSPHKTNINMNQVTTITTQHLVRSTLYLPVKQLRNLAIVSNSDLLYGLLTKSIRSLSNVRHSPTNIKKTNSTTQADIVIKITEGANYHIQSSTSPHKHKHMGYKEYHELHGTKQHANTNPLHHGGGGGGGMYNLLNKTTKQIINYNENILKNNCNTSDECIYKGILYSSISHYIDENDKDDLYNMLLNNIQIYYDPNTRIAKINLILPS